MTYFEHVAVYYICEVNGNSHKNQSTVQIIP